MKGKGDDERQGVELPGLKKVGNAFLETIKKKRAKKRERKGSSFEERNKV